MKQSNKHQRRKQRLTAAATAASLVVSNTIHNLPTIEAFSTPIRASRHTPHRTTTCVGCTTNPRTGCTVSSRGPLHSCSSSMSVDQLLQRGDMQTKAANSKFTAFLQEADNNSIGPRIGSISGRYGGLGTSNVIGADNRDRVGSGINNFGSQSALSVSQSTENILGFHIDDFGDGESSSVSNDNELQFTFEDFAEFNQDEDVFTTDINNPGREIHKVNLNNERRDGDGNKLATTASQYVAASLLKKRGKSTAGGQEKIKSSSRSIRPSSNPKPINISETDVPPWLDWVPTPQQINRLKIFELRAALSERDLSPTGESKEELKSRLVIWSTIQDRQRVRNRIGGLKTLIERSKSRVDEVTYGEVDEEQLYVDNDMLLVEGKFKEYNVDELRDKRRAIKNKDKGNKKGDTVGSKNQGVLGLIDESYFDEEEEDTTTEDSNNNMVNQESITQLSKTFNAPSSTYTNREVRQLYIQAKLADQQGNKSKSKSILHKLRLATPHDMRIIRRLSRLEQEDGNIHAAKSLLLHGLTIDSNNVYLIHGLGQLERTIGNDYTAKKYYRRAIKQIQQQEQQVNGKKQKRPFPNPYHALGTLEHTHGNIRSALNVIKEGIKYCPTNHRLHHALGDVYLDANMLDLAEESYLTGIRYGPEWGKSFVYTSLSYVSYAKGHVNDCRSLLKQSIGMANGGMHGQGVVALGQLEESLGNIDEARKVYRDAISRYERKRRSRSPYHHNGGGKKGSSKMNNKKRSSKTSEDDGDIFDTSSLVDGQGNRYTKSHSGDKWINVFKSWARMEAMHGTYETTHIVFSKAARLFPSNVSMLIQWAELQVDHGDTEKARLLYEAACHRVGSKSAEPYQLYAEFEMKRKNYIEAQSILIRGARAVAGKHHQQQQEEEASRSSSSSTPPSSNPSLDNSDGGKSLGLARLFHTWGVCEYHLGTYSRAEQLLDNALRVTGPEEESSAMRSLILYSMARLEYSRQEYLLAQHCIGLSMKENLLPGGNYLIWKLWSQIADKMENEQLAKRCKEQALLRREEERGGSVSDLSRLLGERRDAEYYGGRLPERTGSAMTSLFRKTPWYSQVCPPSGRMDKNWYDGAKLWDL